jgi:Family of unknown function (DUF6084)
VNPPGDAEIQGRVARIEGLIQSIEEGADGPTRDAARELAAALLGFHGAGLARIFAALEGAGAPGRAVAEACARDDLVAALLTLHDLLPRPDPSLVQLRMGRDAPVPPRPSIEATPDLTFEPAGASAVRDAAAPLLSLGIKIRNLVPDQSVQAILLRCQVRIEPQRRGYAPREQEALGDLFGDPRDHARTLLPLLWTHTGAAVPAFTGETVAEVALPCTYDLAVASGRYFDALDGGEAPLLLLFSGTVFWTRADGALQAAPIAWSKEARFALPVKVFREALDLHYPETAPLLIRRDVFERLREHRARRRFTSWEEALESLLGAAGGP